MKKSFIYLVAMSVFMAVPFAIPTPEVKAINIIVNGGFEAPVLAPGTWSIFETIPGWETTSSTGTGIEIQNHAAGEPFEGNQLVELDSWNNSWMMAQNLDTVVGQQYLFSFAYSPRPGVAAASNGIDVYFDNSLIRSITGAGGASTAWTVYTHTLIAVNEFSRLEFKAVGTSDSYGGYLDAVSMNAVPEPSTMLLLGSGLLGLVALNRRRKS